MFKKLALPVLALLGYVTASDISELQKHHPKEDAQIAKIKADVEKIAQTQFISAVSLPDELEQSWEAFEESLNKEIERRAKITSNKLKNTLIRYKKLMQQAQIQHKMRELAWEGTSIDLIHNRTLGCDMDCVSLCFSDFNYRFENIEQVDQYCLVATCNCQTGHTHYHVEQTNNTNWDITNFGTDRDLYDKNGTQIYTQIGDHLYHRDLAKNGTWLNTWHDEINQTHPYGYRSMENYFEELNQFNYLPTPSAHYNIEQECDIECSESCLSLRDHYPLEVVDLCNVQRCGCHFSTVDTNTCNHDCKASCLFTPGGRNEIQQCLTELCDCNLGDINIPIIDRHNQHINQIHEWENSHGIWRDENHNHHNYSNSTNHTSHHANHTDIAQNHTNSTNLTNSAISMMGFVGYESYLTNGNTEVVPETDLPLITISITFAVFMVLVLSVYFVLLKKEIQNDKKTSMLGYEDKNIYSEKLNFLENQDVCVRTL